MGSLKSYVVFTLAAFAPSAFGAGQFIFRRCSCSAGYAQEYVVNALTGGREVSVTVNTSCDRRRINTCDAWLLSKVCGKSGYCGIGDVCYDVEVTSSDKFSVNGVTYKKNDYAHNLSNIHRSSTCKAICNNVGDQPNTGGDDGASFQITVTGWPEPVWC